MSMDEPAIGVKEPTAMDLALEEAERRADESWRRTRIRSWIRQRLGDGPYDPTGYRRELDALAALVRAQAAAGVPTWLDRPPPPEDRSRCWTCGEPLPPGSKETRAYCSQACQKRDYDLRRAGEAPRRSRTCLGCRRAIAPDAHPSRRYCTPACQKRSAQRAHRRRERAAQVDA